MTHTHWRLPLTACLVLLLLLTAALSPGAGTAAKWFEQLDTAAAEATADRYTAAFADVPSTSERTNTRTGPIWNSPGFTVTNSSQTLARDARIDAITLTSRYRYPDTGLDPLTSARVSLSLAPAGQTCEAQTRDRVLWTVKPASTPAAAGGRYTAPANTRFTLRAGETRHVCVDYAIDAASSTAAERTRLLARFAGGGVKAVTEVAMAEKLSTDGTESAAPTSLYRLALPTPEPDPAHHAGGTDGCSVDVGAIHFRLYWQWPDGQTATASTPAIERWEIWTQTEEGRPWQPLTAGTDHDAISPDARSVRLHRSVIRSWGAFKPLTDREFIVVAVLKAKNPDGTPVRVPASRTISAEWNGSVLLPLLFCDGNYAAPHNVTGGPNTPSREW